LDVRSMTRTTGWALIPIVVGLLKQQSKDGLRMSNKSSPHQT